MEKIDAIVNMINWDDDEPEDNIVECTLIYNAEKQLITITDSEGNLFDFGENGENMFEDITKTDWDSIISEIGEDNDISTLVFG